MALEFVGSTEGVKMSDDFEGYHTLSDEEFRVTIRSRVANELDVSERELDEMSISEIEEELGIETKEPRNHNDHRGGYFVESDRYSVLSEREIEEREEQVERYLSQF